MSGHEEHDFDSNEWRFSIGSPRCHRWCARCGNVRQNGTYTTSASPDGMVVPHPVAVEVVVMSPGVSVDICIPADRPILD